MTANPIICEEQQRQTVLRVRQTRRHAHMRQRSLQKEATRRFPHVEDNGNSKRWTIGMHRRQFVRSGKVMVRSLPSEHQRRSEPVTGDMIRNAHEVSSAGNSNRGEEVYRNNNNT